MSDHTADTERAAPNPAEQRAAVRERYGAIATENTGEGDASEGSDDSCDTGSCCGSESEAGAGGPAEASAEVAERLGYSDEEIDAVEAGANLGLGCGNPTAIANLDPGEAVLDLGSGGGFDCFLAAAEVGEEGQAVGVDMTPSMVERARENVAKNDADNVEFRLGEIEHLPVADRTIDVVISNCVVNLSPDKPAVLSEAYRVLRPGGRVAISDVVLTAEPPAEVRTDLDLIAGCVGGAATIDEFEAMLEDAGFVDVELTPQEDSDEFIRDWDEERDLSEFITSADIRAKKPV